MLGVLTAGLLAVCGTGAPAQSVPFVQYAQKKLMLRDAEGDRILLQLFLNTCETGLKKCVLRRNIAPKEEQLRSPRFWQENPILSIGVDRKVDNSRAKPLFKAEQTLENLKNIIREEEQRGYEVSLGRMHSWSNGNLFVLSKIVVALATASSARFMYVGQEEALIAWIAQQPDNSVQVEDLFRKSYILNKGNVYLSILTIENVLSDATFEKDRENTLVNRKLADLYADSPNKFGDWYHFFGTMLAGYASEPARIIAELYGIYRRISRGQDAEKATMAADLAGADMGIKLRSFVIASDKKLQQMLQKRVEDWNIISKASLGNAKFIGPDGNIYIGPNR